MNAVLLGYGTVGKGVEDLCKNVEDLTLTNVFVLPEFVDEPYFTNDGLSIVTDPKTDIVFECLSGTEPSNTLITAALKAGKHVISSNKATLAPHLKEYVALARENGGSIQLEAAVAGGIPFMDALLKLSLLEQLDGYEGIFNGTSNFILDNMQKNGADYAEVLKEAQKLGYAEANPEADVEGWDVYHKTNISNALAFGTAMQAPIKPVGISKITSTDVNFAKENGLILRHLSTSRTNSGKFGSIIAPAFLEADDYLANIPSNYNAQLVYAPSFEKIGYFGQGAGRYATAQAMVANAIDTIRHTERKIVLDERSVWDDEAVQENWIVRSGADLSDLDGFVRTIPYQDALYYLFENRSQKLADEALARDPMAMAALWRVKE